MSEHQFSMFDGNERLKITKPIRLIELFGGYGSQHFALEYLGAEFEQWKLCEWAVKSIQAYKDAHFKSDNTDYSKDLTKEEIIDYLFSKHISMNYNEPMTFEQIKRLGEQKQRTIYNNIQATHNLVDIQQVKGENLEIADTDKYCYVMTYSFPCQDLSSAGLGKGMEKGSGTRSGMLWEVERILNEIATEGGQLPQVLVMENVPQVHGTKNKESFKQWQTFLVSLGYKNFWQDLNAKNYSIPQNRNRCFMVSILQDCCYDFPKMQKLELKLKDLLEDNVDEKYYISDSMIKYITSKDDSYKVNEKSLVVNRDVACSKTTREGQTRCDCSDYICDDLPNNFNLKEPLGFVSKKINDYLKSHKELPKFFNPYNCVKVDDIAPTQTTFCGSLTSSATVLIKEDNLKKQLCNDLISKGKVQQYDVIRHNYTTSKGGMCVQTNNESPTLDTRCDCLGVVVKSQNKRLSALVKKMDLSVDNQFMDIYNQSTSDISGTITTRVDASNSTAVYANLRIRKLTPKECFRLMGVKDKDFEQIAENQSNASLYHLAGDSIVVPVLMAIFGEMLDIDWQSKVLNFYD